MDYPIRPVPLGKIAPTSGTPVQLTANLTGTPTGNSSILSDAWARAFEFVNVAANTGKIYIGLQTLNRTTLAGVVWVIEKGTVRQFQNAQQTQPYHVGDYWVDVDTTGDFLTGNFDPS